MYEQIPCVWGVEPRLRIYEAIPHKVDTAINNSQAVVDFIARYASDLASECILVFNLDTRGNLINFSRVTMGTLGMAPISGREMFKTAILSNAASIIMAHNHPSGDPTPSQQDVETTKKMFSFPISPISLYHVTLSLNVLMVQIDILAEPPYGPLYGVTSGSKLGFVKASGHRKSLVTTGFLQLQG